MPRCLAICLAIPTEVGPLRCALDEAVALRLVREADELPSGGLAKAFGDDMG